MTEDQVTKVLLVRAVEETDANLFSDQDLQHAHVAAGTDFGQQNWFVSRAAHLIGVLPTGYLSILELAKLPQRWNFAACLLVFLLGLGANYLGPPGKIHVLFKPHCPAGGMEPPGIRGPADPHIAGNPARRRQRSSRVAAPCSP